MVQLEKVHRADEKSRLADLIVDSLTNIRLELRFFEHVAKKYGLDINAREGEASEAVKGYRELFFSTGEGIEAAKLPLLDGLVLLWATEKVICPPPLLFSRESENKTWLTVWEVLSRSLDIRILFLQGSGGKRRGRC
jgi:hypothetical protein